MDDLPFLGRPQTRPTFVIRDSDRARHSDRASNDDSFRRSGTYVSPTVVRFRDFIARFCGSYWSSSAPPAATGTRAGVNASASAPREVMPSFWNTRYRCVLMV